MIRLDSLKFDKVWGYEKWLASTHKAGVQKEFLSALGGSYPLLVKIIKADSSLSVQVHPDDSTAVQLEGEGNVGKTECWYVLDAAPDAKLVYGIKEGYSNQELAKAINENTLESYLEIVSVKPGDFVFIPAGTVHAIGAGLRLMEVQQSCDLTYRLYDWGRGREVHVEKGLAVIKREDMIPVAQFPGEFDCKYFSLQTVDVRGGWSMLCSKGEGPKAWQLIYVISENKAVIRSAGEKVGQPLKAEEIYAVAPGEKITIEGVAKVMRIIAK